MEVLRRGNRRTRPRTGRDPGTAPVVVVASVFLAAFGLYAATAARDVLWQDSGLFVYRIWHRDLVGSLGLALAHPLYILCGIAGGAVPFGAFAHRISLVSAFFGALAITGLFVLVKLWVRQTVPALVAAITLAVSWTFWQHAVIPEAYALSAALLFAELLLLLSFVRGRRPAVLYLLGFVNGLAVSNHVMALFGTLCYAGYVGVRVAGRSLPVRRALTFAGAVLAGASLYLVLVIRQAAETGDLTGALASALFGEAWRGHVVNLVITWRDALENFVFMFLNVPTPNAILLPLGLVAAWRAPRDRAFVRVAAVLAALHLVFAFRYVVADRYAFFLPFYCLMAMFIGYGAAALRKRWPAPGWAAAMIFCALLPIGVHQVTPALARRWYPQMSGGHRRPFLDVYRYHLQPAKHRESSAKLAARAALTDAPVGTVLYAFPTDVHPLLYLQEVDGFRTDVLVTSAFDRTPGAPAPSPDVFDSLAAGRRLFFFTAAPGYMPVFVDSRRGDYRFLPEGSVFRVELSPAARR